MPNKKAAEKALRKNITQEKANLRIKSHVKALFSKGQTAIKEGNRENAVKAVQAFQQAVDKAVKRNVFDRNKANRKKHTLSRSLHKINA